MRRPNFLIDPKNANKKTQEVVQAGLEAIEAEQGILFSTELNQNSSTIYAVLTYTKK